MVCQPPDGRRLDAAHISSYLSAHPPPDAQGVSGPKKYFAARQLEQMGHIPGTLLEEDGRGIAIPMQGSKRPVRTDLGFDGYSSSTIETESDWNRAAKRRRTVTRVPSDIDTGQCHAIPGTQANPYELSPSPPPQPTREPPARSPTSHSKNVKKWYGVRWAMRALVFMTTGPTQRNKSTVAHGESTRVFRQKRRRRPLSTLHVLHRSGASIHQPQ